MLNFKMSSAKWQPFCPSLNVLTHAMQTHHNNVALPRQGLYLHCPMWCLLWICTDSHKKWRLIFMLLFIYRHCIIYIYMYNCLNEMPISKFYSFHGMNSQWWWLFGTESARLLHPCTTLMAGIYLPLGIFKGTVICLWKWWKFLPFMWAHNAFWHQAILTYI